MNRKIANLLIILNFFWFLQNIECYLLRKLKEPNHFTDPCVGLKCTSDEICIADTHTDADCIPLSNINVFSDTHFIHKRNVICVEGDCKTFKQSEFIDPCAKKKCSYQEICIATDSESAECMQISSLTITEDSYYLRRRHSSDSKRVARRVFSNQVTHKFESPCLDACRHGECEIINMTSHICHCVEGVTGEHCNYLSIDSNPCSANPCFSESACINLSENKFVCICRAGRAGPTCQGHVAPCECINDGKCILIDTDTFTCDCPIGYGGHLCQFELMKEITEQPDSNFNQTKEPEQLNKTTELNINKSDQPIHTIDNVYAHSNTCTFDMCENGGTCLQVNPTIALCLCPFNYRGPFCRSTSPENKDRKYTNNQIASKEILCPKHLKGVCLNGGTCHKKITNSTMFKCICQPGYSGTFCDQKEPFCNDLDRCKNGGTCYQTDLIDGKCACTTKFKGLYCEIGLECSQNPCKYNQPCITINGEPKCVCIDGYTGPNCP